MGRQKKAFNRYHLIDDVLTSVKSPYPNLPQIIEYVNAYFNEFYGEEISKRAIQKEVLNNMSKAILSGKITTDSIVLLDAFDNNLVFRNQEDIMA